MNETPKNPPTGTAEALAYCAEQAFGMFPAGHVPAVQLSRHAEYMRSKAMSDDPMVWLVEEFGAERHDGSVGWAVATIGDLISCRIYRGEPVWCVSGVITSRPLTRDDVRRLCEIFGVEVKK